MEKGGKVTMGHMSYGEPIIRGDMSNVHIGKFCSIAQGVKFDCGWHHETNFVTTFPLNVFYKQLNHITGHPKSKGDIVVGNDVWIGEGCTIMGGITIGNGAVIGAGSIVTKNVDPYQIVGGSPAREIRHRFDFWTRLKLDAIKWWDWSDEKIIENGELLMDKNISKFINKHYEKAKV